MDQILKGGFNMKLKWPILIRKKKEREKERKKERKKERRKEDINK